MLSLQVQTISDLDIKYNFEELKSNVIALIEKYDNLVVTDDNIADCKKVRAELNKAKKDINDSAIAIDKEKSAPIKEFRDKIKEVILIIDNPCKKIDDGLKLYEEKQKEEKAIAISEIFNELKAQIKEPIQSITYGQVEDDKWLNATVSLKSIKDNMTDKINALVAGYVCIANFKSDFEVQLLDMYTKNNNLALVLSEKDRLEKNKADSEARKLAEQKRLEAISNVDTSRSMDNMFTQVGLSSAPLPVSAPIIQQPIAKEQPNAQTTRINIEMVVTDKQMLDVEKYLIDSGIKFYLGIA